MRRALLGCQIAWGKGPARHWARGQWKGQAEAAPLQIETEPLPGFP